MKIAVLPENVYSKIAAGEVIDKPAAVIRELIDNAIDAKSSSIHIRLQNGGITSMSITDNGLGMSKENLLLATLKHSTSKIRDIDDLFSLTSMGFRGEALHAIRTVSKLIITSKEESSPNGHRLEILDNEVVVTPCSANNGTHIEIKDIFFNLPARQKFLKSSTIELNSIKSIVSEKIFSHLHVAFALYNNDKLIFRTQGDGDFSAAFFNVYKNEKHIELLSHQADFKDGLKITTFYSPSDYFFNNRKYQQLFVNNRPITASFFYAAISQGYGNYISPGRHPALYCYLEINPNNIDINIHPAKREVRFFDQQAVFSALTQAVKLSYNKVLKEELLKPAENGSSFFVSEYNRPKSNNCDVSKEAAFASQSTQGNELDLLNLYNTHRASIQQEESNFQGAIVRDIKILGTVFKTYICAERGDSLYFIDQHALQEGYIYHLKKKLHLERPEYEQLLIPISIEPMDTGGYLKQRIIYLQNNGFIMEETDGNSLLIRQIPAVLYHISSDELSATLLDWLEEAALPHDSVLDEILIRASCREAVKKGDVLSSVELAELVTVFFEEKITHCPHGRPVYFEITRDAFDKNFQRRK